MSEPTATTEQIFSYCRGCVSSCGLVLEVSNNKILSHRADRESLVSAGFKCVKGDMSVELLQGQEGRLTECLKRDSSGQLGPIDAQQLMDEVANTIAQGIERHGPRSVALYIGTAGYRKAFNLPMAKQFMAEIGSPAIFSTMTIDQSAHWVADGRMGLFATGKGFIQDVDLIILCGTNPVLSHSGPYTPSIPLVRQIPKLQAYKARGGKLIVVDPRETDTARLADVHIQPKPGTDAEIFACLNRLVLQNEWYDRAFCSRYVTNLAALKKAVEPYTPERVAERAGIAPEELVEAARMCGQAKKLSAGFATGTSMSENPNTAAHMIEALNAICGGYMRAGDVVRNPGLFVKRPTTEGVIPPNRSWDSGPRLSSGFGTLYGEFPTSRLPDEILTPGPTQIRTLIVMGANPAMAFGEPARTREALKSLDCLVVLEPRMTETAELAHYVVAPPIQYEVHDFNLMISGWMDEPVIQYTEPVIEPPRGVLTEWKFFNGLANRLGITLKLVPFGFGGSAKDASAAIELDPKTEWTTEHLIEQSFENVGLSLEEVRKHPHGMPMPVAEQRILAPEADDGARLDVCPPDVADELLEISKPKPADSHKYKLVNRRIVELMNTEFRNSPTTLGRYDGAAPLFVNPADMAEEGLQPGERATVIGDHGQITARVRADPTLRRGVVAMPHCWSGERNDDSWKGHTSWLVSMRIPDVQPIDGMPRQSGLPVTIRRTANNLLR